MSAIVFDINAYVKRLVLAGMPEAQAEVIADQQAKLIDERLATKDDLEKLRLTLIIQLGGMILVAIGVVATLVKLL